LTPAYPVTPVIFLVFVALLLVLLGSNNPRQSFLGVGVVALGIPVYYFFFRGAHVRSEP
jgi:APA family basic amino acid/polyamine antiporter